MGSHSVTCHPTQVNTPCLKTLLALPGGYSRQRALSAGDDRNRHYIACQWAEGNYALYSIYIQKLIGDERALTAAKQAGTRVTYP